MYKQHLNFLVLYLFSDSQANVTVDRRQNMKYDLLEIFNKDIKRTLNGL